MRKNKQFVSFLNLESTTTYKFTKVKAKRLIDDIRQHSDKLLTSNFVKQHLSELQTPLFQYTVEDKYKKWSIVKRFEEFLQLSEELKLRYHDKLLPIPVKNVTKVAQKELVQILDFFQLFLNVVGKEECVEEQCFQHFIGGIVGSELKEVKIYFQGILSKRAGGRHNQSTFKKLFNVFTAWEDRLVSITPQGIYLCSKDTLQVEDTLMFSSTFTFLYGQPATGYSYGIIINSSQRILTLDAHNVFNLCLFVRFLSEALDLCEITSDHRFNSFAPVRSSCDAKYYIDGQRYFEDVCEALLGAKKQIFITGWMISPYFSLRRPDPKGQYRVDNIFNRIANAGIKINIVVYNGPKMALNIDSEFTKTYLTKLSPNIKVILHPNYVLIPFMWSHHEKMVVIDQKVAFMGGLDIGYGRFDTRKHLLTNPKHEQIWSGADFCNYRVTDILKPQLFKESSIDPNITPRMPWHDVGVRLVGGSVQDLSRHFIQYWNYVNFQMDMSDRQLLMYVGITEQDVQNAESAQQSKKQYSQSLLDHRRSIRLSNTNDTEQESTFNLLSFFKKQKKVKHQSAVVQLPFQLQPEDKGYCSSQLTCVQDENEIESQQEKQFYRNHMQQVSKFQTLVNKLNPKHLISHRLGTSFEEVVLSESMNYEHNKPEKKRVQQHQILRSASMWSLGLEADKPEHSIWNAYLQLIEKAKQFIYIQNQFFISEHNGIAEAICRRLIKAFEKKEKFRVIIMLPALPGFDGHPANEKAAVFRVQVNLILKTVNKMYHLLQDAFEDQSQIQEYLFVFSLRTSGKVKDKPVTEIIYIHSKIMIIDDRIALIGSANINDRSMKGTRDTELAVVVEDSQVIEVETGNEKRQVIKFAHELRKELYMQHFNLTDKQAEDYFNDDVWSLMIETSKKNHEIYRMLFGCYPDNEMIRFKHMEEIQSKADSSEFDILKLGIKSNAIPFQRHFLCKEDLSLGPSQKEYFVPEINFT